MTLNKRTFFLILFLIVIIPFLLYKITWIARSQKINGAMSYVGKSYTGPIPHVYSVIRFVTGKDTIFFNAADNIIYKPGEVVPVRYQEKNPHDARINIVADLWGDTIVYGGIPVVVLLAIFLHPAIIPRKSKVRLVAKKPFIEIVG